MSINDLPPEILIEICHLSSSRRPSNTYALRTWAQYRKHARSYIISRRKPPLTFIHVCRHWRAVGLSAKFLWSTFSVVSGGLSDATRSRSGSEAAVDHWLSLSRPAVLYLELSSPPGLAGKRKDEIDRAASHCRTIMSSFAVHPERWASLAFGISTALCQDLANMLHDVADSRSNTHECPLETLEIEIKDAEAPNTAAMHSLFSAILKYKALRHLFYISPWPDSSMPPPDLFPFASLRTIFIRASFSFDESVKALMRCTSATEVTLLGTQYSKLRPYTGPTSTDDPGCTTLPHLRHLTLNHRPFDLLKHFTLPSLSTLEVDCLSRNRDQAEAQLDALFERSKCPLRQFTVQDIYHSMSTDEIIDCLAIRCLQSVPVLRVNASGSGRQKVADRILRRSDMVSLIPRIIFSDGYFGWHDERPNDAISLV